MILRLAMLTEHSLVRRIDRTGGQSYGIYHTIWCHL